MLPRKHLPAQYPFSWLKFARLQPGFLFLFLLNLRDQLGIGQTYWDWPSILSVFFFYLLSLGIFRMYWKLDTQNGVIRVLYGDQEMNRELDTQNGIGGDSIVEDLDYQSFVVVIGIILMPCFFVWCTLSKEYSRKARIISFSWLFFWMLLMVWPGIVEALR